jgi:nucleoside-diphosphate kinase
MTAQQTFSIIKPDGVKRNLIGKVFACIEEAGLKIVATKMIHMTENQARQFYAVHRERPFYNSLVQYMTSGPVVVSVLEGENTVVKYRDVMGATNPANAAPGTIRKLYAESIEANVVHGSDSPTNAEIEIRFFFEKPEIHSR